MDVYDFDGTLYRGDSTADFLMWATRRYPRIALTLPRAAIAAMACLGLHVIDKTRFKAVLYRSLVCIPDIERQVERFWATHEERIGGPCCPHPGDLVISGSPEFLLRGVCARRGLPLIASRVDPHTGRVLGPNCSEQEKLRRLKAEYPNAAIDHFYSDSHNDDPLAALATEAYLVNIQKNTLTPWPQKTPHR